MSKRTAILSGIILLCTCFFAQKKSYQNYFLEGNGFLLEENYPAALASFLSAWQIDSLNANINFKVGYCYLFHPSQKHLAEKFLQRSVKDVTKFYKEEDAAFTKAPYYAYLFYGQALHLDYKFDDALKMYSAYEGFLDTKKQKEDIELLQHYRKMVHYAKERTGTPANIVVTNMGDSINSVWPEYSPVISADERVIIFTVRGDKNTGAAAGIRSPDGGYFEDLMVSYAKPEGGFTQPVSLSTTINTNGHEASVSLSPDGQTLIIYRDDKGDGNLYFSGWNGKDWSLPEKFEEEINSKYWETHACFSPDGNTLFFVSDRPGGFGGKDIYRCKKLPNGSWSKPQNMGDKINTQFDEDCPFVHANGNDLYFSSEGHTTMGGYDIMVAELNEQQEINSVRVLPYPINTTDDDVFFVMSADGKRAYYSSAHEDRSGFGEKDIYRISLSSGEGSEPVVLLKGRFVAAKGEKLPAGLEVLVTDKSSGELVGIYRPQRSGTFTSVLAPEKEFVVSYQLDGNEFKTEDLSVKRKDVYQEINREIELTPVQLPSSGNVVKEQVLELQLLQKVQEADVPLANASVKLNKGAAEENFTADKDGVVRITLNQQDKFTVSAKADSLISGEYHFTAADFSSGSTRKKIYLKQQESQNTSARELSFIHFFTYNKNKVEANAEYDQFIAGLVSLAAKGPVVVSIQSSASKVPTTQFGGSNLKLAQTRSLNLKKELSALLAKAGVKMNTVQFKLSNEVGGPQYNNDFLIRRKEFERFQFVRVVVELNH